ncbi:MAG: anti-sigma factor [Gemmatimonadaceae bacterium]|nr:anti-sigma factor [Gemmatimonadaceae bacterium]
MRPLTLDDLRELTPAYIMGTLDEADQEAFQIALRDPSVARLLESELTAHRVTSEALATLYSAMPSPSLKERVVARIAAAAAAPVSPHPAAASAVVSVLPPESASESASESTSESVSEIASGIAVPPPPAPAASRPSVMTPPRPMRVTPPPHATVLARRSGSRGAWIVSAVAAVAAAAAVFFAVTLRQRVQALEAELSAQTRMAERTNRRLAERDSIVSTLTTARRDLLVVQLSAPTNTPSTAAMQMQLFWNPRTGTAVLHAAGLAPLAVDRNYCLWVIRNGTPEAIARFAPDDDGERLLNSVAMPRTIVGVESFAVTEEPSSGSPQPTSAPIIVGTVPLRDATR